MTFQSSVPALFLIFVASARFRWFVSMVSLWCFSFSLTQHVFGGSCPWYLCILSHDDFGCSCLIVSLPSWFRHVHGIRFHFNFKRICMLITVLEQCFRLLEAFVNLVFVPTSTILFLCCPAASVSLNHQMRTLGTRLLFSSASGGNRGTTL